MKSLSKKVKEVMKRFLEEHEYGATDGTDRLRLQKELR
jgi:hypothetical protein